MKTKFLIFFCTFSSTLLFSQFTKEHTYPNAGNIGPVMNGQQLYMVTLEVSGQKYVHIDRVNKNVDLYNLNHSLFKSMSFANGIDLNPNYNGQDILYISQKLFDTDNGIEFMYLDQFFSPNSTSVVTQILNDDGTILFTENGAAPIVKLNVPQFQQPIYNTTAGTKMILSLTNGDANVYSLTGTLTANNVANNTNSSIESQLFPNPSNKSVSVSTSQLPFSGIQIFSADGKLILKTTVNETDKYELDISTLPHGQYFIQTLDKNEQITTSKRLVIN